MVTKVEESAFSQHNFELKELKLKVATLSGAPV